MTCDEVRDQIDAYVLGVLGEAARERVEAHLGACGPCRRALDEVRAADEAVGEALAWAEPGPAFADRVLAGVARPRRRAWPALAAAAAAAAVVCLAVAHRLHRPAEPGGGDTLPLAAAPSQADVVAGQVADALGPTTDGLEPGRGYVALTDAAIEDGRGLFLIPSGTAFASAPDDAVAISVHSGTVLGQVSNGEKVVRVELVPEDGGTVVRTHGAQFYSRALTSGGAVAVGVHVFSGQLELALSDRKVTLRQGDSAIVADGWSAGSTREVEARVERLRSAVGPAMLAERRRLLRRPDAYARLLDAHPQLARLEAAEAELERLDGLRDAANAELGRMVLVASAR